MNVVNDFLSYVCIYHIVDYLILVITIMFIMVVIDPNIFMGFISFIKVNN